jgi:hypothetical protein
MHKAYAPMPLTAVMIQPRVSLSSPIFSRVTLQATGERWRVWAMERKREGRSRGTKMLETV